MNPSKAPSMTKEETMLLVDLIVGCKIITSKATNASNNKLKEEAWQSLTSDFNSSVTSFPRTPQQLRLKWENLKKAARKRCANLRSNSIKTGGGKDYIPPDEVLEKVASLLGNTCAGFSVKFGGDATTMLENDNLNLITEETENPQEVINLNLNSEPVGDGGDGDQREVLREIQIVETVPHKAKKFFFSTASGKNSMGKLKHKLEEEKVRARISRENALTEFLIAKRKRIDLENEEKNLIINKLKLELENAQIENLKLKSGSE